MCLKSPSVPTPLFVLIKDTDYSESSPGKSAGKMKLHNQFKWKLIQRNRVNRINV